MFVAGESSLQLTGDMANPPRSKDLDSGKKEPELKGDTEYEDGTSDTDRYADSVRSSQIFDDLDMKVFGDKPAIKEFWEIIVESIKGGLAETYAIYSGDTVQSESISYSKIFDTRPASGIANDVYNEIKKYAEFIFGDDSLGLGLDDEFAEDAAIDVANNSIHHWTFLGSKKRGEHD